MQLAGDYLALGDAAEWVDGDDVVIVEEDGRLSYKSTPELHVSKVESADDTALTVLGVGYDIVSTENLYLRFANYLDYSNAVVGHPYYTGGRGDVRRTAFVADESGEISGETGDIYV
jgi:hypothetical protein